MLLAPVLLSRDPPLAMDHLLAHRLCGLKFGPITLKKIAKLPGDPIEYDSVSILFYFLKMVVGGYDRAVWKHKSHTDRSWSLQNLRSSLRKKCSSIIIHANMCHKISEIIGGADDAVEKLRLQSVTFAACRDFCVQQNFRIRHCD